MKKKENISREWRSETISHELFRINHYTYRDEEFLHTVKIPRWLKWGCPIEPFKNSYNL